MKLVKELKTYTHTLVVIDPHDILESMGVRVGSLMKVFGFVIRVSYIMRFRSVGHIYLEFQTAGRLPGGLMARINALSDSADKFMMEAKHYEEV